MRVNFMLAGCELVQVSTLATAFLSAPMRAAALIKRKGKGVTRVHQDVLIYLKRYHDREDVSDPAP